VREERRAERFPSDRFSAPPPPLTQNSRFSKAIEADEDYVRPEDRNRGPAKSRFDEEEEFRGPPPVVQNSRFAAAAAEMEVEREAENREREERRAMRGPPRDMDGPPPMPTNLGSLLLLPVMRLIRRKNSKREKIAVLRDNVNTKTEEDKEMVTIVEGSQADLVMIVGDSLVADLVIIVAVIVDLAMIVAVIVDLAMIVAVEDLVVE